MSDMTIIQAIKILFTAASPVVLLCLGYLFSRANKNNKEYDYDKKMVQMDETRAFYEKKYTI